jgi:hypothetical protein
MAMIVFTWDNPTVAAKSKIEAMNVKAKEWREAAMREPGIQTLQAFVHPHGLVASSSVTTWDTLDHAFKFMNSDTWSKIVSDMHEMGAINIKAQLWKPDPTTPVALRKSGEKG